MPTLTDLKQDLASKERELDGIAEKVRTENRSALTEDESKRSKDLRKQIEGTSELISLEEDRQKRMKAQADAEAKEEEEKRKKNPDVSVTQRGDEHLPFQSRLPNGNVNLTRGLGEFLQAVKRSSGQGAECDPRLRTIQKHAEERSTKVDSEGGFLVQADIASELLRNTFDTASLAKYCSTLELSSGSNRLVRNILKDHDRQNYRWGGITASWVNEKETAGYTRPEFRTFTVELDKLLAFAKFTEEEMQDAPLIGQITAQGVRDEFAFKLDSAIFEGEDGKCPQGFMNSAAKLAIAKETGQAAATLNYKNLLNMWMRARGRNLRWYYNREIVSQLAHLSVEVGLGGSAVFIPGGGAAGVPGNILLGLPMEECEHCEALGTEGDIVLADLSAYQLITKGSIAEDSSIHVEYLTDQQTFRWRLRVGGKSMVDKAVLPYKGTLSRSPYITLATRA